MLYENNSIPGQYVLDEKNKKVAVMLNIKTFDKIEEALENYGLIKENKKEKPLKAAEAKVYYSKLLKGK